MVGVNEIFGITKSVVSIYFEPLPAFLTAAGIYLFMTTIAYLGFTGLERRLAIPGMEISVR